MRFLWLILIWCWLSPNVYCQSRQELEKKRQSLSRALNQTNQQLQSTKRNKKIALRKLRTLRDSIAIKTALIDSMTQHTGHLDSLRARQQLVAAALQQDLQGLYQRHKKLVRYYYQQQHQPNTANSAQQLQYQQYSRHALAQRSFQVGMVRRTQQGLSQRASFLSQQKAQKDSLLAQAQRLQTQMNSEQQQKARKMAQLKRQERQLRQRLTQQKKSKRLLSKKIEQAILKQIAEAKAAARRYQQQQKKQQRGNNGTSSNKRPLVLDDEASRAFAQQKGKLLWPIYQGKIVGRYGQHAHPLFKDVLLNNNGIDLQGQYNSVVRNVYQGTVVSVFTIPGYHNAVMVKHGAYYTTYSNIAKVYVKKGQQLKTGGQIGTIGRDPKGQGHLLHFELWHDKNKKNPLHWIQPAGRGKGQL
jgi:septal ring factor EnvC (AmiA/AmiB activator)